jgi:hypothetical protein
VRAPDPSRPKPLCISADHKWAMPPYYGMARETLKL